MCSGYVYTVDPIIYIFTSKAALKTRYPNYFNWFSSITEEVNIQNAYILRALAIKEPKQNIKLCKNQLVLFLLILMYQNTLKKVLPLGIAVS